MNGKKVLIVIVALIIIGKGIQMIGQSIGWTDFIVYCFIAFCLYLLTAVSLVVWRGDNRDA